MELTKQVEKMKEENVTMENRMFDLRSRNAELEIGEIPSVGFLKGV